MKFSRQLFASAAAICAIAQVAPAMAQEAEENIYMRRPLPLNPSTTTSGFRWETTSTVTDLNGNPVDESNYCGPVQRRNTSICVSETNGQQVADSYCGSTSRPPSVEDDYIGTACSFDWVTGAWDEGQPRCTSGEVQSRTVVCQNQDSAVVEDRFCTDPKPALLRTVPDYSGCTGSDPASTPSVRWGAWSYDQTCSANATKTRTGTCQVDGTDVDSSVCTDAGVPLTEMVQEPNYTGCTYGWQTGAWASWSTTCGSATREREVVCHRSDGQVAPDYQCNSKTKPARQETSNQTESCSTQTCYGSEIILTQEGYAPDCQNFIDNTGACPSGTTEGDPSTNGRAECVTRVTGMSSSLCTVYGRRTNEAACTAEPETNPDAGQIAGIHRLVQSRTAQVYDRTGAVIGTYSGINYSKAPTCASQGYPTATGSDADSVVKFGFNVFWSMARQAAGGSAEACFESYDAQQNMSGGGRDLDFSAEFYGR